MRDALSRWLLAVLGPTEAKGWRAWVPLAILPPLAAGLTFVWHLQWLAAAHRLPVGDAGGHLVNVARHLAWLRGGALPAEGFPPAYYVAAAWAADRFGPDPDVVAGATAAFAALLALVLAWAGVRAAGPTAGVVAPLLAAAAPLFADNARQVLLDVPMTAIIVVVWVAVWESRGFRNPVATVLVGVALGAGALVKYTLFPWVLPALVLAGGWMVVRNPASVLPLGLVVAPAWGAAEAIRLRATAPLNSQVDPRLVGSVLHAVELWGLAAVAVAIGARVAMRRWPRAQGLADGAWLAFAAIVAIGLVSPWFLHAMPAVWAKVHHEAIDEVRVSPEADRYVRAALLRSWPYTWLLLQVAAGLEVVWAAVTLWRGGRFGPSWLVLASVGAGTWFTMNRLPVDVRYYLPLIAGTALIVGIGVSRTRLGAWGVGLGVAALAAWQLAAASPIRLSGTGFNPRGAELLPRGGPFAPPAPEATPVLAAAEELIAQVLALKPPTIALVLPHFPEARSLGLEDRGVASVFYLHGFGEGALRTVEAGAAVPKGWVAVMAVRAHEAPAVADVRWTLDASGRRFVLGQNP